MTQTREVTRDVYRDIENAAHDLFTLIHEPMDQLADHCGESEMSHEWDELHDLSKLAHVIASTAARLAAGAPDPGPDPDVPVPYLPAEGLRDLDAAIRAANPGHAVLYGPDFDGEWGDL